MTKTFHNRPEYILQYFPKQLRFLVRHITAIMIIKQFFSVCNTSYQWGFLAFCSPRFPSILPVFYNNHVLVVGIFPNHRFYGMFIFLQTHLIQTKYIHKQARIKHRKPQHLMRMKSFASLT